MDRGADRLGQPVQHVRPQSARAFEEIAEHENIESNPSGNRLQGLSAAMNGAAQVTAERIFRGGFVKSSAAVEQFRQLLGDFLPITSQLL